VLQLQFNASSWTDIRDATGRQLLSGLVEGGGSQSLDGTPPFVVFLGNAPAVSITYKGQPVDTTPFRKGDNTARITLR
jgi:cytoskeleton protein RodZ